MNRFIVKFQVSDGYSYGFDQLVPVQTDLNRADLEEQLWVLAAQARDSDDYEFKLADHTWNAEYLVNEDREPDFEILTVDEWFESE